MSFHHRGYRTLKETSNRQVSKVGSETLPPKNLESLDRSFEIKYIEPFGWGIWWTHRDGRRTLIMVCQSEEIANAKVRILHEVLNEIASDTINGLVYLPIDIQGAIFYE